MLQWAFNKPYVALWRLSQVMLHYRHLWKVMSHCDICQGLCHIVIFVKGYVALWCLSMLTFQCDVIEGYIALWLSHGLLQLVFNKLYLTLWRLSRVMLHYWHSSRVMHIVIFVKGYVALWCLSRFTFHYDIIEGYITLQR